MAEFVMPKLGADMSAGTLTCWRKQVGDVVHRGDIIAEVETEKGNIDVEVFSDGTIEKFLISPGEKVPVGTVLAIIREAAQGDRSTANRPRSDDDSDRGGGTSARETDDRAWPASRAARDRASGDFAFRPSAGQGAGSRSRDGPWNRPWRRDYPGGHRAGSRGKGRRQGGDATRGRFAAGDRSARIRQTIAAAMSRSKREIPHYYLSTTIDMHRALEWLSEENARRPVAERILVRCAGSEGRRPGTARSAGAQRHLGG